MSTEFINDLYDDRNKLSALISKLQSYILSIKSDDDLLQNALTDLMSAQGSFNKYVLHMDRFHTRVRKFAKENRTKRGGNWTKSVKGGIYE